MFLHLKKNIRLYFAILALLSLGLLVFLIFYTYRLHLQITESLSQKSFLTSIEFYAKGKSYRSGQSILPQEMQKQLRAYNLSFYPIEEDACGEIFIESFDQCWDVKTEEGSYTFSWRGDRIYQIYSHILESEVSQFTSSPQLFAQYYGGKPVLKKYVELGDSPPLCLNSILAIEDKSFLDHSGFNLKSIARAFIANLREGRKAQGGSTITQQLVKNYFLTHEKSYKRKFKELIMAILMESMFHKDKILEAYINEIYMGQRGVFEVRGFGSASRYYFQKDLEDLNLPECALLASIINSPGRYHPQRRAENAMQRRELVLSKLLEGNIISSEEFESANAYPLPSFADRELPPPAPYFLDAVLWKHENFEEYPDKLLKVYTTLDTEAQKHAEKAVDYGLQRIFQNYEKRLPKNPENLQALLIAADRETSEVIALVGGSDFQMYPYNRAIRAKRQVGSTMKAFVYLAALRQGYKPTDLLTDQRFTTSYDGQSWSPKNYEDKYYGEIPMFFALSHSLNTATAKLALDIGLDKIIETAKDMGLQSEMQAVPSLSLGAFELHAWELLYAYLKIARLGAFTNLHFVKQVTNDRGEVLYTSNFPPVPPPRDLEQQQIASLISMMKQTLDSGTAQLSRILGFDKIAAGKTGTTSDSKDAWFAGFTPDLVAVSWVGFDDNRSHGLTGASGALPIWTDFMKAMTRNQEDKDFSWPEGMQKLELDSNQLLELGLPIDKAEGMQKMELYQVPSVSD